MLLVETLSQSFMDKPNLVAVISGGDLVTRRCHPNIKQHQPLWNKLIVTLEVLKCNGYKTILLK